MTPTEPADPDDASPEIVKVHLRDVSERAVSYVNEVGLLAEEVDSTTGELLGNFPQAFGHIGLVNAAWALDQAPRSEANRRV